MSIPKFLSCSNLKQFKINPKIAGFVGTDKNGNQIPLPMTHLATVHGLARGKFRTYVMFQNQSVKGGQTYLEEFVNDSFGGPRFEMVSNDAEHSAIVDYIKYLLLGGNLIKPDLKSNLEKQINNLIGVVSQKDIESLIIETPDSIKFEDQEKDLDQLRDEEQEANNKKIE